jgi:hypothetical protein
MVADCLKPRSPSKAKRLQQPPRTARKRIFFASYQSSRYNALMDTQFPAPTEPANPRKDQTPEPTKEAAAALCGRIQTMLHQAIEAGYRFRLDAPPNHYRGACAFTIEVFPPEGSNLPKLNLDLLRDKHGLAPWQGK